MAEVDSYQIVPHHLSTPSTVLKRERFENLVKIYFVKSDELKVCLFLIKILISHYIKTTGGHEGHTRVLVDKKQMPANLTVTCLLMIPASTSN